MKRIIKKLHKKDRKLKKRGYFERKSRVFMVVALLALGGLSIFTYFVVLAVGHPGGGATDSDHAAVVECSGAQVCYTGSQPGYSGSKWVFVKTRSFPASYSSAAPFKNRVAGSAATVQPTQSSDTSVTSRCNGAEGYYVFAVFRYYTSNHKPTKDMKGPFLWKTYKSRTRSRLKYYWDSSKNPHSMSSDGKNSIPSSNRSSAKAWTVSDSEVKEAFKEAKKHGSVSGTWGAGNFSVVCKWPGGSTTESDTEVEGCVNSSDRDVSRYHDKTYGKSYVRNRAESYSSNGNGFKAGEVFAKPGDTIQFCHDYQFGDRFVGRSSVGESAMSGSTLVNKSQWFKISGLRDGSANSKYNFADSTNKIRVGSGAWKKIGQKVTIPASNKNAKPFSFSGDGGTEKGNYWFSIKSPAGSKNYKCNYYHALMEDYKANGFQASGVSGASRLGSRTCQSAAKTRNYSEAGHSIAQKIEYQQLKGWVTKGFFKSGSCSCAHNGLTITKKTYNHYDDIFDGHLIGQTSTSAGSGKCTKSCSTCCNCYTVGETRYCYNKYSDNVSASSFPTKWEYGSNESSTATAYIPFNFNTSVDSSISGGVKFVGGSVSISGDYSIDERKNSTVAPDYEGFEGTASYATITPKNSKFRIYELLLPENYDTSKLSGNANSTTDVCSYYGGHTFCNQLVEKNGPFNKDGDYDGAYDSTYDNITGLSFNRQIPDNEEYVGYKYCVASSMYPSSSHDKAESEYNASQKKASNMSGAAFNDNPGNAGNNKYNVSHLSCVTIAKKPNFQVWGGGFFTNGKIITSVSKKRVGGVYGTKYGTTGVDGIFGSWDEYIIIAGKDVKGMASGAALGYNAGYKLGLMGGISGTSTNQKAVSPETISNNSDNVGNSAINGISSTMLTRLKARFRDKAKKMDSNAADGNMMIESTSGTQYYHRTGNVNLSSLTGYTYTNTGNSTCNSGEQCTGSLTTMPGTAGYLAKNATNYYPKADNTLVIYVEGTLTIDKNICYGSANCTNGQPAKLSSYSDVSTSSISELPQILIFARDITISSDVDRVEAWLILDEDSGGDGLLRTCEMNMPNFHQCSKTLVVTGPVFAKKLQLDRTGGANHGTGAVAGSANVLDRNLGGSAGDGSIAPAEIFNLRSDAYYWAFGQAQRSTEAVTTYTRELAPRY